jgi:MOSC domain-containing protein YiiM
MRLDFGAPHKKRKMEAKLISVQVGLPRTVESHGQEVTTGIFKAPVHHRVQLRRLNLDGDRQADLSVHGGADKAVYSYPSEHYSYWRSELAGEELPWGSFGENFTTQGLTEDSLCIGDRFRIGTAEVIVTQPRMPCYKLGVKFGRDDMVKRFLASRRTGFYLRVLREGEVGAGDEIESLGQDENRVTVADITRLYLREGGRDLLLRAIEVQALPESWRAYFQERA